MLKCVFMISSLIPMSISIKLVYLVDPDPGKVAILDWRHTIFLRSQLQRWGPRFRICNGRKQFIGFKIALITYKGIFNSWILRERGSVCSCFEDWFKEQSAICSEASLYEKCQTRLNEKSHSILKITLKAFQWYKIVLNSSFHFLLIDQSLECWS